MKEDKTIGEIVAADYRAAAVFKEAVHGDRHPELREVARLFSQLNEELLQHLKNEEEVLFPAIKEVMVSDSQKAKETIKSIGFNKLIYK